MVLLKYLITGVKQNQINVLFANQNKFVETTQNTSRFGRLILFKISDEYNRTGETTKLSGEVYFFKLVHTVERLEILLYYSYLFLLSLFHNIAPGLRNYLK